MATELLETLKEDIKHDDKDPLSDLKTMFEEDLQTQTPPQLVGKIMAALISIAMCGQPIGQAIYGVLFDIFAAHTWVVLVGAAIVAFLISFYSKKIFGRLEISK